MELRASLVLLLQRRLDELGLALDDAADLLDVQVEALSLILGGRFRAIDPEQLVAWLRKVGYQVTMELHAPSNLIPTSGRISISPLPHQPETGLRMRQ